MLTSFLVAGFRKTRLAKSPTRTQWKLFRAKTPGFIDNSNIKTCLVVYISKVAPTFQHRRETCSWGSSCLRLWNHLPPPLPVPDPPPASLGDNFQMKGREIIWAYNKVWMPQPAGRGFPASWNTLNHEIPVLEQYDNTGFWPCPAPWKEPFPVHPCLNMLISK